MWRSRGTYNNARCDLMAIQFARARYISRRANGNVVRTAAYIGRTAIKDERNREIHSFKHRDGLAYHDVLLPEGASTKFTSSAVLWNSAEMAEMRKDAQVAREIVLALPANAGVTDADRIRLARSFAQQHFVAKGLAVQIDIHRPHEDKKNKESASPRWDTLVQRPRDGGAASDRANWHAHLLITTRRIEGDRLASRKARDLNPPVRRASVLIDGKFRTGRAVTRWLNPDEAPSAWSWGGLWRDHQNRYFAERSLGTKVEPAAMHPQKHIGPVRMRWPQANERTPRETPRDRVFETPLSGGTWLRART